MNSFQTSNGRVFAPVCITSVSQVDPATDRGLNWRACKLHVLSDSIQRNGFAVVMRWIGGPPMVEKSKP